MLHVDPNKRIKIPQIRSHPWMLGPTVNDATLRSDFGKRKEEVDRQSIKEKQQKRANRQKPLQQQHVAEAKTELEAKRAAGLAQGDTERGQEPSLPSSPTHQIVRPRFDSESAFSFAVRQYEDSTESKESAGLEAKILK